MASIKSRDSNETRGASNFFPPPPSKKDFQQPRAPVRSPPQPQEPPPPPPPASSSSTSQPTASSTRQIGADSSEAWAHFSDVDSDTGLISGDKVDSGKAAAGTGIPTGRSASTTSNQSDASDSDADGDEEEDEDGADPMEMTPEQRTYYMDTFKGLCPSPGAKLAGHQAKGFFEMSRLPPEELSRIWSMADADQDGQLSLAEFCTAMHLVVLRKNRVPLPKRLPHSQYEQLQQDLSPAAEAPLPPPPPPPPPKKQQQQQQQSKMQSEPAVFGGMPPSIGVLHPTPRKPTMLVDITSTPPAAPARGLLEAATAGGQLPTRERLLAAVKEQKEHNHSLVRLNNELAQELKEVTEQRIALELELERVKPLS